MIPAAIRCPCCGDIEGFVPDGAQLTACGITASRRWWCECGTEVDGRGRYVGPSDVCAHLRALGMLPAEGSIGGEAGQ